METKIFVSYTMERTSM